MAKLLLSALLRRRQEGSKPRVLNSQTSRYRATVSTLNGPTDRVLIILTQVEVGHDCLG